MPSKRAIIRRSTTLAIATAMIGALLAIPTTAANATVTGTLSYPEPIPLTPEAVAIVTIIDQTSAPEAGAIAGQQRIDAPTQVPIDFSVVVDTATLDPTHAYALFATITDGLNTWQNPVGQPVITGGPSKGIELTLAPVPASGPASIPGTIAVPAGTVLSPAAVSIAALIKVETGTLVSRQVQPIADPAALAFNVAFDPSLTDPAATYVVKAAIVDGGAVWQNREGVAAIQGGVPVSAVEVPVTPAGTTLPGFSPAPSGAPSTSTGPSAAPSGSATAEPSETAEPTETASATPTATPAPTATPTPTPAPTATPTPTAKPTASPTPTAIPSASATAAASNAPTPTPITGPLKGTLTYKESHPLSTEAFAIVALVRGSARAEEDTIVASEIDRDVSAKPIAFELDFASSDIDPTVTYTVQAILVDGENAWVTGKGVPVLTKGNPSTVAITLSYRPDLVKGTVSGQISAIGLQPTANAYSVAVLVDPATGATLGIDAKSAPTGLPVEFAIPYAITDIVPNNDYVVAAEVIDDNVIWQSPAGVPVITNDNPKSGVQVVITELAGVSPPPSTPTPVPSPAPQPPVDETGSGGLIGILILIALIGAVAAFLIARGRGQPDTVPPPADPSAEATETEPSDQAATEPPPATPPPDGEGPAA